MSYSIHTYIAPIQVADGISNEMYTVRRRSFERVTRVYCCEQTLTTDNFTIIIVITIIVVNCHYGRHRETRIERNVTIRPEPILNAVHVNVK